MAFPSYCTRSSTNIPRHYYPSHSHSLPPMRGESMLGKLSGPAFVGQTYTNPRTNGQMKE